MVIGSATFADHAVATTESHAIKSPLGVVSIQPPFPPLHVGWLKNFGVLSLKASTPYRYSRETAQVAEFTPIRVLPCIRPGQTAAMPESHAAAWEAPVVKTPLPFMGI
jgi:hypothetical protein